MNGQGARRPPISQRSLGSAKSPLAVLYADLKKTKEPPEPRIRHHGITRHQQSFDALEPQAGVARPLVDLDPRHALVPLIYSQHGAFHSAPDPGQGGAGSNITPSSGDM